MSFAFDIKRAFSRGNKRIEPSKGARPYEWVEAKDFKVRHILGLDAAQIESAQKSSTTSTSTNKLRSVTFSDATTARVSTVDTLDKVEGQPWLPSLSHKGSSVLLREDDQPASPEKLSESDLRFQASIHSLRSFYDKSQTPLSVSQQTSDSSSRDFALRRGARSILTMSSQENEHLKQLRQISRLEKGSKCETSRPRLSEVEPPGDLAQPPVVSPVTDVNPERVESRASQGSASRTPISKGGVSVHDKVVVPAKHTLEIEHPYRMVKHVTDPARAKFSVRRPKAGTKNWFDDIESESDAESKTDTEPQFEGDFRSQIEAAFDSGRIGILPPRNSSIMRKRLQVSIPEQEVEQAQTARRDSGLKAPPTKTEKHSRSRKLKIGRLEKVDLKEQSVLYLSCSEEEEEEEEPTSATSHTELAKRRTQASPIGVASSIGSLSTSLMDGPMGGSKIEPDRALFMGTKNSGKLSQQLRNDASVTLPIPRRSSSRVFTYLEDQSSDNSAGHNDLLTSFPRTPTDSLSRHKSLQESLLSEGDSLVSTKLMTVTRQEENLIAAMRLKKIAMKRAYAAGHRQDALKSLELEGSRSETSQRQAVKRAPPLLKPRSPLRLSCYPNTTSPPSKNQVQRHDSATTFETTDSVPQQSTRSSIAKYMDGAPEDLQLPYSPVDGLPLGVSTAPRTTVRPRQIRDTFLSEMTISSTVSQSIPTASEGSANGRGSHVVVLDPIERQRPREDIPSQLFMERPYLGWQGWEARANMQTAH